MKESAKKEKKPAKKKNAMESVPSSTNRITMCIWIVNELMKHPSGLTLEEIKNNYRNYLDAKYYYDQIMRSKMKDDFDRRTFMNYKLGILQMFHICIYCDNDYRYHLDEKLDSQVTRWLVNSFATNETLMQNHRIQDRILLEEIPTNETYLEKVLEAMRENKKISFKYMDFTDKRPRLIQMADPYCVKLYEKRWYMVVKQYAMNPETGVTEDEKCVYSLDRIQQFSIEEETFKMEEDFSAEVFFYHAFGVRVEKDAKVYTVRLKINAVQMPYFEKLKLHHSQTVVETHEDYSIVTLNVALTIELFMKLMYYGPLIEVLSPEELRLEMARRVYWMAKQYEEVDDAIVEDYMDAVEEAEADD